MRRGADAGRLRRPRHLSLSEFTFGRIGNPLLRELPGDPRVHSCLPAVDAERPQTNSRNRLSAWATSSSSSTSRGRRCSSRSTSTLRILAVIYVPRNRRPQTAMAWLLAIFALPVPGFLLFLLLGNRRLSKRRREKQREINEYIINTTDGIDRVSTDPPWPTYLEPIVELNRNLGAMPMVGGNDAKLYPHYEESLAGDDRRDRHRAEVRAHRVLHPCSRHDDRAVLQSPRGCHGSRRRRARAVRPHRLLALGRLQEDEEAAHEDRRALGADAARAAAAAASGSAPTCATIASCSSSTASIAFTGSQNFIDSSYNLQARTSSAACTGKT